MDRKDIGLIPNLTTFFTFWLAAPVRKSQDRGTIGSEIKYG
jgi:hypothetical protein